MQQEQDGTTASTEMDDTPSTTDTTNVAAASAENKVERMIQACRDGNLHIISTLLTEDASWYASQQDATTGTSPLMAAASVGNVQLVRHLLQAGAPWNAMDRNGQCAGNFATQHEHWSVVNVLVDWAVQAELLLGRVQYNQRREQKQQQQQQQQPVTFTTGSSSNSNTSKNLPVQHEPSTKPDYLQQPLSYTADGRALLDRDQDAVMMEWERPIMRAHAQILMEEQTETASAVSGVAQANRRARGNNKTVLNVGFGMGIIDTILQQDEYSPRRHYIIEAHPDVYQHMMETGWDQKPNVVILFGKWQDVIPQLVAALQKNDDFQLDAIFFDTYGEHYLDMQDFHELVVQPLLAKPHGIYSFFNGLAPDNLFFHGVACQCVKLQLVALGLDAEFLPCEIQAVNQNIKDHQDWDNVRRPYWHGRDTYYLPRVVWNAQFLETGTIRPPADEYDNNSSSNKHEQDEDMEDTKRQRT
jgi:type IV protein arginine methyltransferase